MKIIEIPQEHAMVTLSNTEILALRRAIARTRDSMTAEQFMHNFEIHPDHATRLCRELSEALDRGLGQPS